MKTDELVIYVDHGGLGDHLFFSHIPRIAKNYGYKKVFVSSRSDFRNNDIKQLVWETNPYVDGFVDFGGQIFKGFKNINGCNLLDEIMLFYGLDDGLRFHEPEIYYQPKIIRELLGGDVYDPNYISNVGALSKTKLLKYLDGINFQLIKRDQNFFLEKNVPILIPKDIWEYCDIIFSCRNFYCLTSGGATLAAALKVRATVFYGWGQNKDHRHSNLLRYVELSTPYKRLAWFFIRLRRFVVKKFNA